ncbi:MAG TPA: hypothetical protein VLA09_03145 [Longimicrobiales bacterium]|nr:hypothetical protein [Longimicrobiales bacterium]
MSEQTYVPRYKTFLPGESRAEVVEAAAPTERVSPVPSNGFAHFLTWTALSACLISWAVIGFAFWLPLVLSAMLRFTYDLSRGMLRGDQPAEAGRTLREAVSFYFRGFTVAVDAVFRADDADKKRQAQKRKRAPLSTRRVVFDVLWAIVFWHLCLYGAGFVEASPLDGWISLFQLPWSDLWSAAENAFANGVLNS